MNPKPKPIPKIPVLILSGFLGSGKTTLLNRLLTGLPRSAVIINEFGTTPIDPQLLREHKVPLSTLSGGCLCCQVRDALAPVLKNLRIDWENKTDKPFDRIVIETSGVANPEPVLDVLLRQRWIASRFSLQGVIATISAQTGLDILVRFPEAQAQIAWADTVAVTHIDLADAGKIHQLDERLKALSPAAKRIQVTKGEVDPTSLLAFPEKFRYLDSNAAAGLSVHNFNSMSLQFEQPLSWCRLEPLLRKLQAKYGDKLVRMKGLIFDPIYSYPLLIQASVDTFYPPAHLTYRESGDAISRLVFITDGEIIGLKETILADLD